jgi:Mor family transcriptional regulator
VGYVNALKVLPKELVDQIQRYVDGQIIYIPKPKNKWCKWGENTDTKEYIEQRNTKLYIDYKDGATILELSKRYFLDPKSVQRIIMAMRG